MHRPSFVQDSEEPRSVTNSKEQRDSSAARKADSRGVAAVAKVMGESRVSLNDHVFPINSESSSTRSHSRVSTATTDATSGWTRTTRDTGFAPQSDSEIAKRGIARQEPGAVYNCLKRGIDVAGSIVGLVLFSPIILIVALLIVLDSGGPIVHRRRVLESHAYDDETLPRTFEAYKFRTMIPDADAVLQNDPDLMEEYSKEFKLRDDPRVTRIGYRLRRMSLDEIPQLVNVLRGQMTLVGPRMISPPELAMYGPHAGLLLTVKPGLTGLWQVSGRQDISYKERVRLDLWYIENRSLLLDLQILTRTLGTVLARRGAF